MNVIDSPNEFTVSCIPKLNGSIRSGEDDFVVRRECYEMRMGWSVWGGVITLHVRSGERQQTLGIFIEFRPDNTIRMNKSISGIVKEEMRQ
jgi:hypothetical protein